MLIKFDYLLFTFEFTFMDNFEFVECIERILNFATNCKKIKINLKLEAGLL